MLNLLQINLHHSKAASAALQLRLTTCEVDIVLIQESWTNDFKMLAVKNEGNNRTCILARNHPNTFLLSNFSGRDITAVSVEVGDTCYWLTSVYCAHDDQGPLPSVVVRNFVDAVVNAGQHIILCCDANAHHTIC